MIKGFGPLFFLYVKHKNKILDFSIDIDYNYSENKIKEVDLMSIVIFDTETTSLNKPFCYNLGYVIVDASTFEILKKEDFVIKQIWENLPLFATAYYAEKRNIYISAMRGKKAEMIKYGYAMSKMITDFKRYDVKKAYAYNASFDDSVFSFNCDWYKVRNPFDNIPIYDIRGMVTKFITDTENYKNFCEENEFFTETKRNYSTTAETVYRYITKNLDFEEAHTALSDSIIETEIMHYCIKNGASLEEEYSVKTTIPRIKATNFEIYVNNEKIYEGVYRKKYTRNNKFYFRE